MRAGEGRSGRMGERESGQTSPKGWNIGTADEICGTKNRLYPEGVE